MSVVAIPEPVTIDIAGQSDRGKDREENQALVRHARTQCGDLLVVADGIGDALAGSQASRKAADTISSRIEGMPAFLPSEIAVEEALHQANTELTAMAAEPDCPYSNVGVTLVMALLRRDGDRARVTIGRVGDSRAYLVRDRKLTLLTLDHSATQDMLDGKWTTGEAETYPNRSMATRYLGEGLNLHVEMREMALQAGDTLLLCSDGLWSHVSEQEIERVVADEARSVEDASCALLNLALDAGGRESVAIEIARLTQSSTSPATAAHSVKPQLEGLAEITVTRGTPAIEWPKPESITYGAPLNDTQLNATSSVPGTFQYHPGPGARLATGEHTLSVIFTPSNESDYTLAQAAVLLTVARATPSVSWPTPDPINNTTPLGSAQLNASASVPGTFAYRPAAGETLGTGAHALSVTFTPADCVNYMQAQASVPLTVIEPIPAAINWPSPSPISYGTVLGDEQLSARSSVPGSFLYVPAPGNLLPPGEYDLSVIFTPEDRVKYAEARAAVTLIVEARPIFVPLTDAGLPTPLASGVVRGDGYAANESAIAPRLPYASEAPASPPETSEGPQAEITLFRSFQSSIDGEQGQKSASKWSMIFSAVIAIPMLCVLIFLVMKAHSGSPLIANQVEQPAPAAADTQPPSNTQAPSHRVEVTVNQLPTGTEGQSASNSQPGNDDRAVKPTEAQTETTHNRLAAQTKISQGNKEPATANVPSSARSGKTHAEGPGGTDRVVNGDSQPTDRDGALSPVYVSANTAAARLMESRTPIYPPMAKASGVSGTVELEAIISNDGTVKDLRVVSGPAQLRQAAIQSVRTWRYRPFTVNNEPRDVETTISVIFSFDK